MEVTNQDKIAFLNALKKNNNQFDEISVGEQIGFDWDKTTAIITQLESEGKIEFQSFGLCSYKVR